MASWAQFARLEPELANRARDYLDAHRHLTLATLRRSGAPRITGTEVRFVAEDLWLGSMFGSMKAHDLRRDGRFALHSGSDDPPGWRGDATVSGRVEEIVDPERLAAVLGEHAESGAHLFRCEIHEVAVVALADPPDHITIDTWREDRGARRVERH